jgi:hypothetical protein
LHTHLKPDDTLEGCLRRLSRALVFPRLGGSDQIIFLIVSSHTESAGSLGFGKYFLPSPDEKIETVLPMASLLSTNILPTGKPSA